MSATARLDKSISTVKTKECDVSVDAQVLAASYSPDSVRVTFEVRLKGSQANHLAMPCCSFSGLLQAAIFLRSSIAFAFLFFTKRAVRLLDLVNRI
ncbi:MAG: hypothetical protein JOY62_08480 [Acidobacteriaceae bacterium]|nr:hypothetical protein [Acidobacteriaceae bacterium]MBV9779997.1 hypothetical protein [Acidobacteriaceae bacterium]